MKQHDLLKILCEEQPNIFTITLSLRDKKVIIDAAGTHWQKIYDYPAFMRTSLTVLAKEILSDYYNSRNL
ncbi:hypothetical protein KAU11_12015 [Candidatus Babeliales bacterium]|nr:hypothetical protein [Candidatus Babeliales bacterium]